MKTIALACLLVAPALASAAAPCRSPQQVAQTFVDNLPPIGDDPAVAASCFEAPKGVSVDQLADRARQLKAVLDAHGFEVDPDALSDAPDYRDGRRRARAVLVDGFERMYLVRRGERWVLPASIVQRIPKLYDDAFSGWTAAVVDRLPGVFRVSVLGFALWQILGLVALLVITGVISRAVRFIVRSRLAVLLRRWEITETAQMLANIAKPLGWLASAGVFSFLLPKLMLTVGTAHVLFLAAKVVAVLSGVTLVYRVVDLFCARLAVKAASTADKTDDQLISLTRTALRVAVIAIGVVFVLQNLRINVGSLLAGLGLGGLAFALAAKDTAANLFGSIMILLDRPFQVGDWIVAAGVEGTVTDIGLRSTRVRTFYDSEVTVPNSKLATANVDNMSRRTYRRIKTTLNLTYATTPSQVEAFVEGIRAIITAHPDTRKDYYEIHFVNYGESSLDIMVYCFVKVDTWSDELAARHNIFLSIMRLAEHLGVGFAFPTRTLHVESLAKPGERPDAGTPDDDALALTVRSFGPNGELSAPSGRRLTDGYFAGQEIARGPDQGDT